MDTKERTILVVEDERPLLAAIATKLETRGLNTVTTRTVEQAKNMLRDLGQVDAIWLDHYLLGKESGLDLVVWCKNEHAEFKNIPIFVVSNTASPDKVQAYIKFGITKYYVKAEKRLDEIVDEVAKEISSAQE